MPLALEPRTGDFTPYLKFNGKAGRWYIKNDMGDEVEVTDLNAIFDLAQIKTGWILFTEGAAPDTVWDNGAMSQQPSPKHRRGFSVNVFSPQKLGGVREYSSSSNVSIVSIKELHDAFERAPEAQQGLVPVVKCERIDPIKSKFGTNFQPVLKIDRWVNRPEAMPLESQGTLPLPRAPATHVPPPINQAATAPTNEDDEEF
jgi:hypothetical protein